MAPTTVRPCFHPSSVACGDQQCGPGSVCDDQGSCIPYPPCADVACLDDGSCWGTFCSCERAIDCTPPSDDLLNGPFGLEVGDLDVVTVAPFTGEVIRFQVMPGPGRVTVSPDGRLYFSPMYIIDPQPIQSWDIPDSF